MATRILIVEDDPLMRNIMQKVLANAGYEVTVTSDGYEAIIKVKEENYDLIVTDVRMPGIDGIETLTQVKQYQPNVKSIVVTAFADEHAPVRAVNLGVDAYLYKPFEIKDFLEIVKKKVGEPVTTTVTIQTSASETNEYIDIIKAFVSALGTEKAFETIRSMSQSNPKIMDVFKQLCPDTEKKNSFPLKHCYDLIKLSRAYLEAGSYSIAQRGYDEALNILGENTPPELKMEICLGLAASNKENKDKALEHIEKAKVIIPLVEQYWEGQISFAHGCLLDYWGRQVLPNTKMIEETREHMAKAENIFRQWGDPYYLAYSLIYLINLEINSKQEAIAVKHINDLLELAKNHHLFHLFIQETTRVMSILVKALTLNIHTDIVMAIFKKLGAAACEGVRPLLQDEDPGLRRIAMEIYSTSVNEKVVSLRLHSFGPLRIFAGGLWLGEEQLSKKEKELLIYLFLHDQASINEISKVFWPSSSLEEGVQSAKKSLANVRKRLEPYLTDDSKSSYILEQKETYCFNKERNILCDLVAFQEDRKKGFKLEESSLKDEALSHFLEAERSYGGAFLEDHDSPWILEYREKFKKSYKEIALKIISYYEEKKNITKALSFAKKLTLELSTDKEAYEIFIKLLYISGKSEEALKQLKSYQERFGSAPKELEELLGKLHIKV